MRKDSPPTHFTTGLPSKGGCFSTSASEPEETGMEFKLFYHAGNLGAHT